MAESPSPLEQAPPPHAQLVQMGMAHWVSHITYVAARLNLADHLADGPLGAEPLATLTATLPADAHPRQPGDS